MYLLSKKKWATNKVKYRAYNRSNMDTSNIVILLLDPLKHMSSINSQYLILGIMNEHPHL